MGPNAPEPRASESLTTRRLIKVAIVEDDAVVRTTLSCLAERYSDKELSDKLGITVPTVRTHLTHIYEKLHVQSRTETVIKHLH